MDCKIFNNLISSYVDGEIDDKGLKSLMDHIEECPSCIKTLAYHKIVKNIIGQCMYNKDGDLRSCLCDQIMRKISLLNDK